MRTAYRRQRWALAFLIGSAAHWVSAAEPTEQCHLDLLAGYEGQGIRIHSTFQKNEDEFSNGNGVLFYVGDNVEEVQLSGGIGHLANGTTAVLSYSSGKTVVLVINWKQGTVSSGSINGLPLVPSLSNTVGCNAPIVKRPLVMPPLSTFG